MRLKHLLKTATFRHSFISFAGTTLTGILGLLFYSYIARTLSPTNYGIFSLSVTTLALVASIANLGTDTGVIRFVAEFAQTNKEKSLKFLKIGLEIKLAIWLVLLFAGWITMPSIVSTFFNKPELIIPFRISLIGVGGMLLSSFSLSALQAYSQFTWWSILNVGANVVRLVTAVVLGVSGVLMVENALWLYGGVLFLLFIVNLFLLPNFLKVKADASLRKQFLRFNKWVATFTAVSAIGSRMDTYLLARFLNLSNVGTYSVGVNLVSFVTQIVLALGSVVAPKLSAMKDRSTAIKYLAKLQWFVLGLSVAGVSVGIPIGYFLIPKVFGAQYTGSIVPFSILLIGQAIFLLSVPVHMAIMYYFSQPKIFVFTTIFRLVLGFVVALLLIPILGEVGAAISVLVGNISDFVIPGLWVIKEFKKQK